MTDIFQRLAARARGEERQLRPQVQGLFEPQSRDDDGFVEMNEESVTPVQPRQAAADNAAPVTSQQDFPAAPRPDAPAQPRATPRNRDATAAAPKPTASPTTESARSSDSGQAPAVAPDPAPATLPQHRHAVTTTPDAAARSPSQSTRQRNESTATTTATAPAAPARDRSQPERSGAARAVPATTPVADASTAAPPGTPGQPFATFRQPPEAVRPGVWQPQAGRQVHIHIDHIEVRQQTRAAAEPTPPRRAANPAPDLNDYLRRRS